MSAAPTDHRLWHRSPSCGHAPCQRPAQGAGPPPAGYIRSPRARTARQERSGAASRAFGRRRRRALPLLSTRRSRRAALTAMSRRSAASTPRSLRRTVHSTARRYRRSPMHRAAEPRAGALTCATCHQSDIAASVPRSDPWGTGCRAATWWVALDIGGETGDGQYDAKITHPHPPVTLSDRCDSAGRATPCWRFLVASEVMQTGFAIGSRGPMSCDLSLTHGWVASPVQGGTAIR
jgi:hypothetical protein